MITRNDYVDFPPLMVEFLNYMDAIKNKSKNTISEYALDLRTFFRFVKIARGLVPPSTDEKDIVIKDIDAEFIKSITLSDAYSFLSYCKDERNNSARTRARKVSTLRAFFKFCTVQKHILKENPMQELDTPKLKQTLPKYLTLEESTDLLRSSFDGPNKERDFAIITLFLNCGMRLSELVSLNYTDIRDDHTVKITGKGNKERTIYLNDACMAAINAYMAVRPVDMVKDKNALFLSSRLKRISPKTVQHIVYTALEKAGLSGYSVHKLRHTAATLMYQYGNADVLVLKEILGHENVGTTQIYTHVVNDQLKKATDANPLNTMSLNSKVSKE
ncbi:MAG: tyrosine recombinase XerC [Oscillospiraceae bacterium]|nr:tyrosine recombinase XerC [Oscillospiraceae bacterium]